MNILTILVRVATRPVKYGIVPYLAIKCCVPYWTNTGRCLFRIFPNAPYKSEVSTRSTEKRMKWGKEGLCKPGLHQRGHKHLAKRVERRRNVLHFCYYYFFSFFFHLEYSVPFYCAFCKVSPHRICLIFSTLYAQYLLKTSSVYVYKSFFFLYAQYLLRHVQSMFISV